MSEGLKLLSAILQNNSTVTFRMLDSEIFVRDEVDAYQFIRQHRQRYSELPDLGTVERELGKRFPRAPECVDHYLDKVMDRKFYNDVLPNVQDLRESMKEHDMEQVRERISELGRVARTSTQRQDIRTIGELTTDVLGAYRQAQLTVGLSGIPTGFETLDMETGGWQNGDLVYYVARPGIGKTWVLLHNLMTAYHNNKSCLVVTTEMTLQQIATRWYSLIAGVNPDSARKGKLSYFTRRRYEETLLAMGNENSIHIYGAGFGSRVQHIDDLIQELNPDIVYIDGAYLLKPNTTRSMGRFEAAAYVQDDLKTMTIQRNRPVVCTTQFGRGAEKGGKKGSLENVGYTDTIATHSSIVMALKPSDPVVHEYTDEFDRQKSRERSHYRNIEILKGREGEAGNFWFNYGICPYNFSEVDEETASGNPNLEGPDLDYMES